MPAFAALLMIATLSSPAMARDLPYGEAPLAETKTHGTQVEETGSGKIERHYDAKGQLTEVTFIDYSLEPPQVERLTVHGSDRVRTTERGRALLRRETEHYDKTGGLKSREVEACIQEGCNPLNHRTVFDYGGGKVTVTEYDLFDDRWKLQNTSQQPSL